MTYDPNALIAGDMTLTGQVVNRLLDYIKTHNLGVGDELPTEARLVEMWQVSRVALREAFCYLKALGLVTSRRGSGIRVAAPDMVNVLERLLRHLTRPGTAELNELFELRRILELGCVGDAVEKANGAQLDAIEQNCSAFEQLICAEPLDFDRIDEAEIRFHAALMAPANCRMLKVIAAALGEFFRQRHILDDGAYERQRLEKISREHRLIASAYQMHSPESAYFALRRHLNY